MVGGLGAGAGRDFVGVSVSSVGTGAGHNLIGVHVAGIAVGAPNVRGVIIAGVAAGGVDVHAFVVAPAYFNVRDGGVMRGLSISSFNRIQGEQQGITIGILNYARKLSGFQFGLINIAQNKSRFKVMPIMNYAK